MIPDKAPVIPLQLHPEFQDWHRVNELKTMLLRETLAYVQLALDNSVKPGGSSSQAVKILERACALLDESRDRLVHELL